MGGLRRMELLARRAAYVVERIRCLEILGPQLGRGRGEHVLTKNFRARLR